MEEKKFNLVFKGDIAAGAEIGEVKNKLCALFKADISKIEVLFAGKPSVLKKDLPETEAVKMKAAFDKSGAIAVLEPVSGVTAPKAPEIRDRRDFTCPKCGYVQEKAASCASCGVIYAKLKDDTEKQINADRQQAVSYAPPFVQAVPDPPKYTRVGGFLLLFCLGLTVFAPLITFGALIVGYRDASPYFAKFPGLLVITEIDIVLSTALMAFSIYAGIGLWRIRPGAVQTAKRYLLCLLGYQVIAAILPFMAGLPSEANDAMAADIGKDMFRAILYVAIWYSYLCKSQRVKDTYGI